MGMNLFPNILCPNDDLKNQNMDATCLFWTLIIRKGTTAIKLELVLFNITVKRGEGGRSNIVK